MKRDNAQMFLLPFDMDVATREIEKELLNDRDAEVDEVFNRGRSVFFDGEMYEVKRIHLLQQYEEKEDAAIRIYGIEVKGERHRYFLFSVQFEMKSRKIIKGQLKWDGNHYVMSFMPTEIFRPRDFFFFTDREKGYGFRMTL